jgi:hypothetical protein
LFFELHTYYYIVYYKNANKQYQEVLFAPQHGSASSAPGTGAHTKPCQRDKEAAIPPHHT